MLTDPNPIQEHACSQNAVLQQQQQQQQQEVIRPLARFKPKSMEWMGGEIRSQHILVNHLYSPW